MVKCSILLLMTMIGKNGNQHNLETSPQSIILFSKNSSVSQIKSLKNEEKKIISFDYDSHKILSSNNVEHEISDNYLSSDDLQLIQKLSYKFAKWFKEDKISNILNYEDINLGLLIQVEFNYFLVQFIKKYFEILKITTTYPNSSFFVSHDLNDLTSIFTQKINIINEQTTSKNDFYYDSVRIPLKIGNKTFRIKISKNSYKKLQTICDKAINLLFSPKEKDFSTSKNSTLAIEFDTIRYKSIFNNLPNSNLNLVVYSRRSPPIWNSKSYSIMKNSGSKILSSSILLDKKLKQKIDDDKKIIKSIILALLDQEEFFENFFLINEKSIWIALKSTFQTLIEKRFNESITEIQLAKKTLLQNNFSSILVWSEIGSTEQIMVKLAKKLGISVVVLQHGLFFDSDDEGAFDMNDFQGVFPYDADYYVVWGDIEKTHAVKSGISQEKIFSLGSPIFDELPSSTNPTNDYILLATSGPVQENAFDLTIDSIKKNQKVIEEVCSVVNKMGKKLIIKIHPSPDEFDPTQLTQSINSQFLVFKSGDISELILNCAVFVVIDISTVMLNSQIMKKPVISIITKDSNYGFPTIITSKSCVSINIDDFETTLKNILNDQNYSNSIINDGLFYANQYTFHQGSSASKLLNFISNLK